MKINLRKVEEVMMNEGMTWKELSEKAGISKTHISRIVTGKVEDVRIDTVSKLAKALNVPGDGILERG